MVAISRAAVDLIVAEEVSSEAVYRKKYTRPEWPGFSSGVTIGIGYDVGYSTPARLESNWRGRIPDGMIQALKRACGVTGSPAKSLARALRSTVSVPWEAAIAEFREVEIPRWISKVQTALPNTDKLSADCLGALVSLAYNRGPAFSNTGDRFKEMRAIKYFMQTEQFDKIPDQIRAMKRLWPGSGLVARREREAKLFERGLKASAPSTPKPQLPPPREDPKDEDAPTTKPATRSKTILASIVGIVTSIVAAIGEVATSPYFWAFILLVIVFGYIIWERNGKPDIRGWFRS